MKRTRRFYTVSTHSGLVRVGNYADQKIWRHVQLTMFETDVDDDVNDDDDVIDNE